MKKHNINFNASYVGPRQDILDLIPADCKNILDLGCSTGTLGESIKAKTKARVVGAELSKDMSDIAAKRLDRVIVGDIEKPEIFSKLKSEKFDVIILGDILEHLRDPWSLLNNLQELLSPRGSVVASIPNVRHLDTVFNLIFKGYWPYRERGIHDKTHLRFFTLKNILEMFSNAKLKVEKIDVHYRVIETPHFLNQYAKYFAFPIIRDFLAFQYLIVAGKK